MYVYAYVHMCVCYLHMLVDAQYSDHLDCTVLRKWNMIDNWVKVKTVLTLLIMICFGVFFLPAKLFDEAEWNLYYLESCERLHHLSIFLYLLICTKRLDSFSYQYKCSLFS